MASEIDPPGNGICIYIPATCSRQVRNMFAFQTAVDRLAGRESLFAKVRSGHGCGVFAVWVQNSVGKQSFATIGRNYI